MTDDEHGRPAVLRARGLVLHLDGAGTVVSAASATSPGVPWLAEAGSLDIRTAYGPVALGPPTVAVDADEVEVEHLAPGLRVVVRHGVDAAWTVRVVLTNESDEELVLEHVRLGCRPAPGTVVTALAAGAQASYAVAPAGGAGPVLLGRLRSGAQPGVDESGLLLGPLLLGPHHRWAVQWRWEVVADARHADPTGELPRTTWLELDQTVLLPGGPDVAVVAPGLAVDVQEDRVEVGASEPGPATVELRSARGTTVYALSWAPRLDDLVDVEAEVALAGPTSPGGTVRLRDAASGLLVQDALRRRSVGPPEELVDALELLAGLQVDELDAGAAGGAAPDPLTLAFLAREADRAADPVLLDAATRGLLAVASPAPGIGLAGVGIALARVRAGEPAADVVGHLGALAGAPRAPGPDGAGQDDAALELALLLRPRTAVDGVLVPGLRHLGATLGAGLPGRVLPEPALERVAHAATLLSLVDERTGQDLRRGWGISASELARRTAAQARARLAQDDQAGGGRRALAWLVLGRPSG